MDSLFGKTAQYPDYDYQALYDGSVPWTARLKAVPLVLVNRIRRGGLGLLLRIIGAVLGILLLLKLLGPSVDYRNVFSWSSKEKTKGGNLRIVVFGSQDLMGSAVDLTQERATWPERLCNELNCDSLMSFVPTSDFQDGLTSNGLYGAELDNLQKIAQEANIVETPAADWFYVGDQYPVPAETPDLEQQVQQFLSLRAPDQPPHETLWIFTFGTWDIWKLAAMPKETGENVVDALTDLLFNQIEKLYRESLDQRSIAFSDFWSNATRSQVQELTDPDALESVDERKLESFRIIIPQLFDVSLTPGWNVRPEPSMPHTSAEQLRNSAVLTERWNNKIREHMDDWSAKGSTRPEGMEEGDIESKPIEVPKANSILEYLPVSLRPSQSDPEDKIVYAQYPRRAGYRSDPARAILDIITEEEMHRMGVQDSEGRGTMSVDEPMRFLDVWTPCVSNEIPELGWDGKCEKPEDHLFHDAFTLSQRAIDELSKLTAEGVMQNLMKVE